MSASSGNTGLLDLPDNLLLLVLRLLLRDDGTQKAENVRDLLNMLRTCDRIATLVVRMMYVVSTTSLVLVEGVPHDVMTAMPDDVLNGTLLTLFADRSGMNALRVLRLGVMSRSELRLALALLQGCPALTELWFVDVPGGVTVPKEVARRVEILSIASLHTSTLDSLLKEKCRPKRLRLNCVDNGTRAGLYDSWMRLTLKSTKADMTYAFELQICMSILMYERLVREQHDIFRVHTERRSSPFGPPYASIMRLTDDRKGGWKTAWISKWIQQAAEGAQQREVELCAEEGLLTVVMDGPNEAIALQEDDDALLKRFVREIISPVNPDGRVEKLQVLVDKFVGEQGMTMANVAARLVAEAASSGGVRKLSVSSPVFLAFEHVPLPASVDSVGVVDELVCSSFVRALPATLEALARRAALLGTRWYVWMQMMRLEHNEDALQRETLLREALSACRLAERDGLCATGVRGTIEQWLQET
ncbi:hypothetical protein FGB62_9g410 [Gracilaria domingensis]|nr:hypothetical protein FGB62_9g410 [Gracilaria domingensis]